MSDATRFPPILPLQTPNSLFLPSNRVGFSNTKSSRSVADLWGCLNINNELNTGWCLKAISDLGQQGSVPVLDYSSSPVSVDLKPILNECEFDRVVDEAHRVDESVIVLWMAKWCRKCIYLKPKLEKLAAVYHPRVKFYCIDVNNVPHQLVVRAGVTKMPTIQLWKDGKKQAEVIGGHKAYLVANEVREMIDDEGQP